VNPLFTAALEVQDLCRRQGWGFCFIGGLAVLRWGEPRLTRDIDLTILAEFGNEEPIIDGLLSRFTARFDNAREFARRNRVVLLAADNGVPVDVALGALDFEERAVQRASAWNVDEAALCTCGAEDLVVHKVFAGRDQDWVDVAGIIQRQRGGLDRDLILDELAPLLELKGSVSDVDRLRHLLR
jgi:Nucleotidyl transferase AbiEii toxin, Type IV TA system